MLAGHGPGKDRARRVERAAFAGAWAERVGVELHALEKKQYVDPVTFAEIHSTLGEMDEALRWYERAYLDRTPNMAHATIASRISLELAGNPRYKAIVDRMGFPRPAE
jgi:hypothetical protein